MSQANDANPNRAPWTSPSGPSGSGELHPAPYASDQSPPRGAHPEKRGLGCWVWGCLGTIVFMLVAMVAVGFATYYFVTSQVAKYTDTQAAELPVVEMEAEDLEALEQRIESFTTQVRSKSNPGTATDPAIEGETDVSVDSDPAIEDQTPPLTRELVLTAREINGLIASKPELRGRVFVDIQDGVVSGKVSFPTDGVPGGAGRFFNADAEFDVSMQDGVLLVRLTDASVKGERIPQQFLDGLSGENLAKDVYSDPDNAEMLRKFDSIEVVGDSIVLRLKESENRERTEATMETEATPDVKPMTTSSEGSDVEVEPPAESVPE